MSGIATRGSAPGSAARPGVVCGIVNWNTREDLRTCLGALAPDADDGVVIVVVDNNSSDGSADMVEEAFPWVHLIRAQRNLGFAGGVNLAFQHTSSDYVMMLNPDMRVSRSDILSMKEYLDDNPGVAATSPLLVGLDGQVQTHLYCRFPTLAQVTLFWTVLSPIARRIAPLRRRLFEHDLRADPPVAVDQLPGAAMMISRAALENIGHLDEGYFIWWEDVDWCYRARQKRLPLHVLTRVRCSHAGGMSFVAWNFEARVFQFYRAFYRFLAKHEMYAFARRVRPVLLADLFIKAGLIRLLRLLRLRDKEGAHTLDDARRAMADAVAGMGQGRVPHFDSAVPEPRHD